MAQTIKCPVCGESNPAELEFCQYCQSRLQRETGATGSLGEPIQPGQAPTKKTTAELEPILPQWLREARTKARQSAEEEAAQMAEQSSAESISPAKQEPDLLAGLQSQDSDEEEETPDWLASITGAPARSKKPEMDGKEVRWVELGSREEDAPVPPGVPASTNRITATQAPSEAMPDAPLPPWMAEVTSAQDVGGPDELADFFSHADAQQQAESQGADSSTESGFGAFEAFNRPQSPAANQESADWLKSLEAASSSVSEPFKDDQAPFSADVPEWLKSAPEVPAEPAGKSPEDAPDWLKSFAAAPPLEEAQHEQAAPVEDLPDWLKTFARAASTPSESIEPPAGAAPDLEAQRPEIFAPETSAVESVPAFVDESLSSGDLDSLFTDMPDWLSSPAGEQKPAQELPPAAQGAENILPADLPSWVQAMRPVESSLSSSPAAPGLGANQPAETRGPLAGLQGVLPASPFIPTSKPKAYSIKLQASEEQQAHAALLEYILETETKPEPISFIPLAGSARSLRWIIAFLLLLIAAGALLAGAQTFTMPFALGIPIELQAAITAAETIPENAPVLVVFDYEPATVGEMEAAAAPLLDHVMLLKHPRLTFISTSPTGSALAERLISGPLGGHGYQSGIQYVDLGYLPGGLAGIRAFAQEPRRAAPLTVNLTSAWNSAPLQDVQSISNFASIILITDSAEAGRAWVEQAGPLRGNASLIIVSSAQAGPMFFSYLQSGQVSGLVNGLNAGAVLEQYNSGRPGTIRRYWDAYSLGLFLAMAFIAIGGMWNLAAGLQARRAAKEDK
jgi:hypothetical protein